MRAARLYGFGDIKIEEMPVPEPGPGEALMKVRASGVCSGEVMPWYINRKAPLVPGHEPAGEIVKAGPGVTAFSPGDRVFAHHHAPCMKCSHCKRGMHVQCRAWREQGLEPGGMAEYVLIRELSLSNDTLKLPDTVGYDDATLIEPLGCVLKGLGRAGLREGETVLVIGLGAMGALNVLASLALGAGRVIGADTVPYRLEKALALGGAGVVDVSERPLAQGVADMTGSEMADVVVVGPGSVDAITEGIASAARGGRVLIFTPVTPGEMLEIDPNLVYFKDISLITSYSCGPADTRAALGMIEDGAVRAEQVVTHRFTLDEAALAYDLTAGAGDSLKCIVEF